MTKPIVTREGRTPPMSNEQSAPVRQEIQHYSWCDDWVNAWTDSDENGEIAVTFATEEEAEDELREFLEERPTRTRRGTVSFH